MEDTISPYSPQGKHYVYTLAYPDGRVFYVGKGTGHRINRHETQARKGLQSYKCNVIRKIWSDGGQVVKSKLAFFHTHQDAYAYEIALIFLMDGLSNLTYGGEGAFGHVCSEETKQKISAANMGSKNPLKGNRGRTMSEETRRKVSEAVKQRPPISEETRQKLSRAHKGIARTEEWKKKISEAKKGRGVGRKASEETRGKMSAMRKGKPGKPRSEESRRKQSEARRGKHIRNPRSAEYRRKLSEATKRYYQRRKSVVQLELWDSA